MGYWVEYYGVISFDARDELGLVQAAKDLNFRHDLKGTYHNRGVDNPFVNYNFSWLPTDYHENSDLNTVESILELLGFDIQRTHRNESHRVTHEVTYSDKMGDEQIFLAELVRNGASVDLFFKGEDGIYNHFLSRNGVLYEYPGLVRYDYGAGTNVWEVQVGRAEILTRYGVEF